MSSRTSTPIESSLSIRIWLISSYVWSWSCISLSPGYPFALPEVVRLPLTLPLAFFSVVLIASFLAASIFCSMTLILVSWRFFTFTSFFSLVLHRTSFYLLLALACVNFSISCLYCSPYCTTCCICCRSMMSWF